MKWDARLSLVTMLIAFGIVLIAITVNVIEPLSQEQMAGSFVPAIVIMVGGSFPYTIRAMSETED